MNQFTSDGCSGGMSWFWRTVLRRNPPWEGCCFVHDQASIDARTWEEQKTADHTLALCVAMNGHPLWAGFMYSAVRAYAYMRPLWRAIRKTWS